jgi:hypothetical protein
MRRIHARQMGGAGVSLQVTGFPSMVRERGSGIVGAFGVVTAGE